MQIKNIQTRNMKDKLTKPRDLATDGSPISKMLISPRKRDPLGKIFSLPPNIMHKIARFTSSCP
uniref:Uncharacterized protein n=1 Tax=Romanomermis culicivorax TaxID=13658 RepID=A0A915ISP6_ROMCU